MRPDTLFICASVVFGSQHVLAAAEAWGELAALRETARMRLACMSAARAQDLSCDDNALQAASEAFRRARGLKNGELTRAWMERWQVDVDAFGDYLERAEFARARATLSPDFHIDQIAAETVDEILWPEAVFSGHAERWCEALAQRAVAALALEDNTALMAPLPQCLPLLDAALERFTARPHARSNAIRARVALARLSEF